jgi:hypothetical protein
LSRSEARLWLHLQFEWEEADGDEGHLSYHGYHVPRVGDHVSLSYKEEGRIEVVRGKVKEVRWDFDPDDAVYPMVFLTDVTRSVIKKEG